MVKEIWRAKTFAWYWLHFWKDPARPTREELKFIKSFTSRLKKKRKKIEVLILGSTLEYRELMKKLKIKPTVVDFSLKNYQILSQKIKYPYQKEENFVLADWRTMKLEKKFDLILAEASLNMVEKKSLEKLLKNIAFYLKENGYFLSKTWIRYSNKRPNLISFIYKHQKRIKRTSFYQTTAPLFYLYFYDFKKDRYLFTDLWQGVQQLFQKGIIDKKILLSLKKLGLDRFSTAFFMPEKKWLEKKFRKYFKLKQVKIFKYWLNKYFPTYILIKKT